eukprot:scaffold207_cov409-Prasinococcus_capsulatus_cf.AAC.31
MSVLVIIGTGVTVIILGASEALPQPSRSASQATETSTTGPPVVLFDKRRPAVNSVLAHQES